MKQTSTIPQPSSQQPDLETEQPKVVSGTRSRDGWKGILSTILILLAAPLIAIFLTSFVFQSYEVDGPSMETTLSNHDRLIVWKVPRSIARVTKHTYIPKRGDVVVFVKHDSFNVSEEPGRQLIKRVIALPGERVIVKEGVLTVYNSQHPEGFQPDKGASYNIDVTTGNVDIVVPAGEVFVCGDNRNNSLDSRTFGTVDAKEIVGKLIFRIFPLSKAKGF